MRYSRLTLLAMSCMLTVLSALGCCDKEKKQIAALQADNKVLADRKAALQSENAKLQTRLQERLDQLDARDSELLSANQQIASLQEQLKAKPEEKEKKEGDWEVGLHGDRVTLTSDILFASGRASLTRAGQATLNRIVATLRTKYAGMPVRVYGYTDSDPVRKSRKLWTDNLDLSANRAMAVARHLRAAGIAAESIETIAMGNTRPVASNSSTAGKAKNRRVEIVVVKK